MFVSESHLFGERGGGVFCVVRVAQPLVNCGSLFAFFILVVALYTLLTVSDLAPSNFFFNIFYFH